MNIGDTINGRKVKHWERIVCNGMDDRYILPSLDVLKQAMEKHKGNDFSDVEIITTSNGECIISQYVLEDEV